MTKECGDPYVGTTTRSGYVRGGEHQRDLDNKKEESDLWRHCQSKHNGEIKKFKMDIIETFPWDPLLRQVPEDTRINQQSTKRKRYQQEG